MKKQILTLAAAILLSGAAAFAQNGMTKFEQLPAKSQEFIKTYFKDYKVSYILADREFADVDYKVRFEDGTEIEFNAKGEWTDVSGKQKCIPTDFILTEITEYVNTVHKDLCITDVEREFNRITVELSNNLEIEFNSKGKVISYDD
ncbi:MAG: PepSY-like domain-containing protein [Bacteroidales bacterium]|nr:PepSY-like domain-containing protein [Bacteroidales bacterium]